MSGRYCVVVHGINTQGKDSVDRFGLEIAQRGYEVVDPPLPVRHFWNVRRTLKEDVQQVADVIRGLDGRRPVTLVAHSHGGNIALGVLREIAVHSCYLFNPAVDRDHRFDGILCDLDRVYCIHSHDDWIVKLSRFLPFNHPFGDAGARGFDNLPGINNRPTWGTHSRAFEEPMLSYWVNFVTNVDQEDRS